MLQSFAVSVDPGVLHFNAAHFITYNNSCENLHGHNFHVRINATGDNRSDDLVIDFVLITELATAICMELNDKVLLPTKSDVVNIELHDSFVHISSYDKRFILPEINCNLLPVRNTTAEMLASYICDSLIKSMKNQDAISNVSEIEVAVEEADRQWGICRRVLEHVS